MNCSRSRLIPTGRFGGDELTVGLCDERYGELLERVGRRSGVPLRASVGTSLSRSQPVRLLALLGRYLKEPTLAEFSALLRLPMWEELISTRLGGSASADVLEDLDDWSQKRVGGTLEELTGGNPPAGRMRLRHVSFACSRNARPCCSPFVRLPACPVRRASLRALFELLAGHPALIGELVDFWKHADPIFDALVADQRMPALDGPVLLDLVHQQLSRHARPGQAITPGQAVIEMVGWLDVRQDPAQRIILVGFNESGELAPPGVDAWLPDSLREQLGLSCESRRRARDAHAIHALAARTTNLHVIVSRVDLRGEPVVPSRLYLGSGGEEGAHRVLRTMNAQPFSRPAHLLAGMPEPATVESFGAPVPPSELEIESLNVTDFEAWMRSPRRFWLERQLRLKTVEPDPLELDPRSFGTLAHDVLQKFGESDLRDATDASRILEFLEETLRDKVRKEYGAPCLPTIELQTRMLLRRFQRFASIQAGIAAEGWRCHLVERRLVATLDVPDGRPVEIVGRVDRIDRHEDGRWRVLDYKTSSKAAELRRKRTAKGAWKDLQLPLYDYLVRRTVAQLDDSVEVGYFAIPKELGGLGVNTAGEWDSSIMADGVRRAREVVLEMRRGDFDVESMSSGGSREPDGIDRILRSSALEFRLDDSDEEVDE